MSILTEIRSLDEHVGSEVALGGWVVSVRASGKILFLVLRDGTGMTQCVLERTDETAGLFETVRHLGQETSVLVRGRVRAEPRSVGGFELDTAGVEVVGSSSDYPITPKSHGIEFLLKHRHLWLRSRREHAVLRVRHTLVQAIRDFFDDRGFVLINTPILAAAAGEEAQTLFEVDYFGEQAFLAQTGQLYVEAAAMAHRKVYCFGPTFRAEKSKTRRHLTEFWMVEPEIAFADLDDVIALAEDFVASIVAKVLDAHRPELELLGRDLAALEKVRKPFARIRYDDAVEILHSDDTRQALQQRLAERRARHEELTGQVEQWESQRSGPGVKKWRADKLGQDIATAREELADLAEEIANIPHHMELAAGFTWGKDLGGSDETIISRHFETPVFVTHYPKEAKAFYMYLDRDDPRVVRNFDLLAPEGVGEIIGGSQREDELEVLLGRMAAMGLDPADYEWYLDLRRYGTVPHGGFGLGVERTLGWLCGLTHVRQAIPFPRVLGKMYP